MGEAFNREVDIVKDVKNEEGLKQLTGGGSVDMNDVINKTENDFKDFDNLIEKSFQEFLIKINSRISNNKADMKALFNEWLDREYKNLDYLRNNEIAQKVIEPISFELNTMQFTTELTNFEKNFHIFSREVDQNHIHQLFTLDFDDREELLGYLEHAQNNADAIRNGDENIRKFQRKIANLDVNSSENDKSDTTKQILGKSGVDGKFGVNTVKALEQYISNHLAKGKLSLNNETTTLDDRDGIRTYIDQNKEKGELDLSNIQTITPEVAQELAKFNGTINLTGLTNIRPEILTAFINNLTNNTIVQFPKGTLKKDSNGPLIQIGEQTYTNITNNINTICSKLISDTTETINNDPSNSNQGSNHVDGSNPINNGNNGRYTELQDEGFNYYINQEEIEGLEKIDDDKKAIELAVLGTAHSLVARIFRIKGYDKKYGLVDKDYDPMRNRPERLNLKALSNGLEQCLGENGKIDKEVLVNALNGKVEQGNRSKEQFDYLKELSNLYNNYQSLNDQPFFQRIMGMIDDYFVQGKRGVDGKAIETFSDFYNNLIIGSNDLNRRERDVGDEAGEIQLTDIKEQLNLLEEDIIGDKNEKLTREYRSMIVAMSNINKLLNTETGNFQFVMDQYKFNEESIFKDLNQVKFACCLCDLNTDGRVDAADKNTKTGQELFNLIVDAQIEGQDAMNNILDYAEGYAEQCGHGNTLKKLQELNSIGDTSKKIEYIAKNPILMQYLREMLTKTSIDNVRSIILKGSVEKIELTEEEKKFWEYMMNPEVGKAVEERFADALAELKKDLEKNEDLTEDQKEKILKELESNPESIKRMLKTAFSGYLALGEGSLGVGAQVLNFGDIFKTALDSNFGLGAYGGFNRNGALFGLSLTGGASRAIRDRLQFTLGGATTGSYNFGEGGGLGLSALLAPGILGEINGKYLENTLDVSPASYLGLNAIGLGTLNPANREGGLGVGGAISARNDMLVGIDQTSKNMSMKVLDSLINAYNTGKGKGNFLDEAKFNELVKEQLKTIFPETQEKTYDKTLKILYTGLLYYLQKNNGEGDNAPSDAEMGKIFDNVSKDFALNWKNTAVASLNGDVDMTGLSMGAIYVWGTGIVPLIGIQLTNYENLFAHDTQESRNRYESSLYSEAGMDLIDNDEERDGEIGPETVKYLNKKLSLFLPRGINANIVYTTNIGNPEPNKGYLEIPKELCKHIDISYSEKIQNHIEEDGDCFRVPKNMRIGLSTYIGGGTMRANLILGDNKKSPSDKPLTNDSVFNEGNSCLNYQPDTERISLFDVNNINKSLIDFQKSNPDFPLRSCERANGEQILFNVKNGQEVSIDRNSPLLQQGGKILLTGNPSGELKIVKDLQGKYVVSFDSNNTNKLLIKYNKIEKFEGKFEFTSQNIENLFKKYDEKILATLDDNEKKLYSDFMEHSHIDPNTAFNTLLNLLNKSKNDTIINFKNDLNKINNLSDTDKMLIVDRFKAIFSYNKLLDKFNKIVEIMKKREEGGDTYKTLVSRYTDEAFPLANSTTNYREAILSKLKDKESIKRDAAHPNLIGMTAFYRYDNKVGKGYMLTQLGGTNVLGNETEEITNPQDKQNTQNWLINSLERNPLYEKTLLEKIADTLNVDKEKINNYDENTIHEKLSGLLKGKSVDIGQKNVKIKAKYVFYLLGECANESIGVEIDGVEEGSYSDSTTIDDYNISRSSAGLYVRSQASESQMGINANRINFLYYDVPGGGGEPKPNDHTNPVDPIPEPEPDPNVNTDPTG